MIDIIKAIILGIVEGLTEFLPVSSTGHLIIINEWLTFSPQFTITFDIVIQLGAIIAVVVIFFDRLNPFGKAEDERKKIIKVWSLTIVGVLPAVVLGLLFDDFIEERLFNPIVVAIMLIIGGIVFLLIEKKEKKIKFDDVSQISYKQAFYIGLIQCLAMIPGTSRSASTIIGGMLLGLNRLAAATFSFFLAIPTMFGATFYSLLKVDYEFGANEIVVLAVGFFVSFVVALGVIKVFLSYISKNNFIPFGYYRIVVGVIVFVYFVFK